MISRRKAIAGSLAGLIAAMTPALARAKKSSSPVAQFDTDHDGSVSLDEAKKAAADEFDKLDRDHDGTLTRRELRGRLSGKQFTAADTDKDGTISKDEYLALVEKRFKAADADNDGKLSDAEFRTAAGRALLQLLE